MWKRPTRYKHVEPKEHIRRSLGTKNPIVAEIRLKNVRDEVLAELENKLNGGKQKSSKVIAPQKSDHHLMDAHIPAIAHNFKTYELQKDDEKRKTISDLEFDAYCEEIKRQLLTVKRALATRKFSEFQPLAKERLKWEKLVCPPNAIFDRLVNALANAQRETLEEIDLRNQGVFKDSSLGSQFIAARELPTLSDAWALWKENKSNQKTIRAYGNCVADFEIENGRIPLAAIDSAMVDKYIQKLVVENLAEDTILNRVGYIATMVSCLSREVRRTEKNIAIVTLKIGSKLANNENPFTKHQLPKFESKVAKQERQPFEVEEAQAVLDAVSSDANMDGEKHVGNEEFKNFVYLSFFTGARREELAQLKGKDLSYEEGHPCIHIHGKNGNKLKTVASTRKIPLHGQLIKGGCLAFLEEKLRNAPEDLVFGSIVSKSKYERKGEAIGKRFSRLLHKLGLNRDGLCLHSTRYNVKQALRIPSNDAATVDAYMGHYDKSDTGRYDVKNGVFNVAPLTVLITATRFGYHIV